MTTKFRRINLSYVPLAKELANIAIFGAIESSTETESGIYNRESEDTGSFVIPAGNTNQRGNLQVNGALRFNTETNYLEIYYANTWVNFMYFGYINATGGTITTDGNYKIHTFTSSGTFSVIDSPEFYDSSLSNVEYLIVGGGGGGGDRHGAGGGGGGFVSGVTNAVPSSTYTITVGAGGGGGSYPEGGQPNINGGRGIAGTSSTLTIGGVTHTATGGGGGGTYPGSTGGTAGTNGFAGARVPLGGGGGGAGAAGSGATGGAGKEWIDSSYYGGGGGGGQQGPGGIGGGGAGWLSLDGEAGTINTGGGGGGTRSPNPYWQKGGAGGSGIVKIRYRYQ